MTDKTKGKEEKNHEHVLVTAKDGGERLCGKIRMGKVK